MRVFASFYAFSASRTSWLGAPASIPMIFGRPEGSPLKWQNSQNSIVLGIFGRSIGVVREIRAVKRRVFLVSLCPKPWTSIGDVQKNFVESIRSDLDIFLFFGNLAKF